MGTDGAPFSLPDSVTLITINLGVKRISTVICQV